MSASANTCPANHDLTVRTDLSGFVCDLCNTQSAASESSLQCIPCDFDACIGCSAEKGNVKCRENHALQRNVIPHDGYSCDECGAPIPNQASSAGCRECDYDICISCLSTKLADANAAPTSFNTLAEMWAEVQRLEQKALPKSILALVKDTIIPAARRANDHAQLLKATMFLAKGTIETEDVGMDVGMQVLESELNAPTFITTPSEVCFLHSMMGELYQRYLDLTRHTISDRTDPGEEAALPADIKVWAPAQLERVAFGHYVKSVANPEALAKESTGDYNAVLSNAFVEGSFEGRIRPTLLDFLGHRALSYFSNENSFLSEPSNRFVLRDKVAFGDTKAFVGSQFATTDATSRRFRALELYQSMLRVKLAAVGADSRKAALSLVELDLLRIQFVRNSLKGFSETELRTMHGEALLSLLKSTTESAAAAGSVLVALGDYYRSLPIAKPLPADGAAPEEEGGDEASRLDLPTALKYYNEVLKVCREEENPVAVSKVQRCIGEIELATLSAMSESVVAPGTPILVTTTSKNLDGLTYRVVRLTAAERDEYNNIRGNDQRRQFVLACPVVVQDASLDLGRPAGDYYDRRVEFIAGTAGSSGHYMVLVWPQGVRVEAEGNLLVAAQFQVSRLAIVKAHIQNKEQHVVVDRTTGEPLGGVTATIFRTEWASGRTKRTEIGSATSDANGFFAFPRLPENTHNVNVVYTLGDDTLDASDSYREQRTFPDHYVGTHTYFFLDRNMYRPGQTVYFKGLAVTRSESGAPSIRKGVSLRVAFIDANYQEKESVTVTTNDYGSFEGTFTAPLTGLTGSMRIETEGGSVSFRVEEYKRPKFEVTLKAPAQKVRVGGAAKVEGTAINFSGIPLGNATVKYRVRRVARAPWFWGFWCRVPRWAGKSAEILTGTVTADEKGKFEIEFTAVPDSDLSAEDKPEFDYEVSADVTDITGETQTGSTSMKVGYVALQVGVPLADTMSLDALRKLPISLTDLNGNAIAASAEVALEPLVTPYPMGSPFIDRYWQLPNRIAMDKAAFKQALPQFAYTDEATPAKWARKGDRFVRTVTSDGVASSAETDLARGDLVANTYYRVSVSAKDSFGVAITVSRIVQVFDSDSLSSVSMASAQTPSLMFGSPTYRVGDTAIVRYGKRIRFDGRPQPVLVTLSSVSQAGTAEWDRGNASRVTPDVLVQERAVAVREADRGHLSAACVFVAYGRAFVASTSASVPWVEKELSFEYVSFRNKLEPGQQEEWRIKVKSADPKADPREVVAAEVVAALYDASLDKLTGNREHNYRSDVQSLFPMPSPALYFSNGNGFNANFGNQIGNVGRPQSSTVRINYPQLNWFSFPFRSERPMPMMNCMMARGGPRMMAMCAAPMMARCAAPMAMECDTMAVGGAAPMARMAKRAAPAREKGLVACNAVEAEMCDEATGDSNDNDNANDDAPAPAVRTNLKETVFFMPNLRTEADGTVVLRFTMGEALTRWRLLAFAHTPDLKTGTHSDGTIITQKEVMVTPNPPRFLREGDTMSFAAKVSNMGDVARDGTATLELLDGVTGAPINEAYGLPAKAEAPFSCGAGGQSAAVAWGIKVPFGGPSVVTWRIVARSGRVGDGEESTLPVVSNRMLVTDTMPMSVRGGQQKTFTLKSLANTTSTTLSHEAYTVEFTSNPAWYAVQALPYMMEFPHECSEQLFTRYYSNTLAAHITQQQPQIQRVFEAWRLLGSDALKSNLHRNEELKSALLEETPWVMEAQSEEQQRKQIALLFDLNRMGSEQSRALEKLRARQLGDGGFAWFPGGQGSTFITQHIAMGFAHLAHLGVKGVATDIQVKAQAFCHDMLIAEYDRLLERVREGRSKLEDQHVGHSHLLFLYTESFAALHKDQFRQQTKRPEVMAYYVGQAAKYWTSFGLYGQALIALILHRGQANVVAADIIKSLRERALHSEEMGTYFKYASGYYYYEAPIETQSLMVEVFREVAKDAAFVDELRLWLLKNKQTKHWKTTKQTSEAVYALLLGGESWLDSTGLVSVQVGDKPLPMVNPEPGTGYVKHRYAKAEVVPAMATVSVTNPNKVVAWGAAYWQYFEALDKIQWFQETPLKIKKEVFGLAVTERGEVLRLLSEGQGLAVGDKVRIRIEIVVDREMSYMHLKDMRASGLEPVNVLSQYKWQDGLGYYESTKDLATHFFMDHLPKGTFVFEYTLVASQRGDFSNGITTMQCMYAPEFTSHSQGIRLAIK